MSGVNFDGEKFRVFVDGEFYRIEKADDGRFVIGGYASVFLEDEFGNAIGDDQNDIVELDALEEAFKRMMAKESRRNLMGVHTNAQIGELIWEYIDSEGILWDSQVVFVPTIQYSKKGLFILAEIFDDVEEAKRFRYEMKKNKMLSLSIGGEALRRKEVCNENTCVNKIVSMDLYEVSSCEVGVNREAKARVMKGTKTHPLLERAGSGGELLSLLRN